MTLRPPHRPQRATSAPSRPPPRAPSHSDNPRAGQVLEHFDKVTVTGAYGEEPKVKVTEPWAIDKTRTKVLDSSNGAVVKENQTVEVNYYGVNGRSGEMFDESFSTGQPIAFNLGQVVPGFSKGLVGQRQGAEY